MHVTPLAWWLTIGLTSALLIFDVVVIGRRAQEPSRREVTIALVLFIGLAVVVSSMSVGIVLGLVAAFNRGIVSIVIMRMMVVVVMWPARPN